MLQLLGDSVPQTPCRGFASGPHWGIVSHRPSDSFCSAPLQYFPKVYAYDHKHCLGMAYQHTLSNHHQLNASNPSWQNFAPRRAEKGANEIFVTMGVNGEFLHFGGF